MTCNDLPAACMEPLQGTVAKSDNFFTCIARRIVTSDQLYSFLNINKDAMVVPIRIRTVIQYSPTTFKFKKAKVVGEKKKEIRVASPIL